MVFPFVNLMVIWYILPCFGILYQENLATLIAPRLINTKLIRMWRLFNHLCVN
jgi:hypothetical protein